MPISLFFLCAWILQDIKSVSGILVHREYTCAAPALLNTPGSWGVSGMHAEKNHNSSKAA